MTIRKTKWLVLFAVALVFAAALLTPTAIELITIQNVRAAYELDTAVYNHSLNNRPDRPPVEDLWDPPYLKGYDLSVNKYMDPKHYFAPNGNNWVNWSTRTKVAAIIFFASPKTPSIWNIRYVLHRTNDYYAQHPKTMLLVNVLEGAEDTAK